MADRMKAVIKNADMSEEMQSDAIDCATVVSCPAGRWPAAPAPGPGRAQGRLDPQALEKFHVEKDTAAYIKKEFDKKHNPTWHCIVGRNFGAR